MGLAFTVTTPVPKFEITAESQLPLVLTLERATVPPLLVMVIVPCCVLVDPAGAVIVSGFGFAARPDVPPLPTVRLTVIDRLPFGVTTITVPVSLPLLDVRLDGVTVICTLVPRFVA